ncbi:hypothetical protein TBLA_0F03640 [Henningerozyma blattae CBS 6284]|uniref:RNA polymerase II subunit B1 CTD phosphatase RPAP2 homolog n=1 Tax=Henningerozyma blattae (strain ATCC 34711 / CBS 6284 / DSM 70876 / NBRC 10599 / NRRL Y-10934 / UCD 77-7) TaxID=1071380 RepID=I2H699_HENB6|nr:hypothetical protein TBLA_0F03640 [Tetrapisispora blattae CBS 6284]CCH61901.1 hypothetical protein TBLA_0F03640 [Tetrapisispora blattae CBS 6284]
MASVEDIKNIFGPYQEHHQLTIYENEKIILDIVELICDSYCKDLRTLKFLGQILTQQDYEELIEERNISQKCGYPLCHLSQERTNANGRDQFTKNFMIQNNPYNYLNNYCTLKHYKSSMIFKLQLNEEPLFERWKSFNKYMSQLQNTDTILDASLVRADIRLYEDFEMEDNNRSVENEEIKRIIKNIRALNINNGEQDIDANQLSSLLEEIKITEIENPLPLGDLQKNTVND